MTPIYALCFCAEDQPKTQNSKFGRICVSLPALFLYLPILSVSSIELLNWVVVASGIWYTAIQLSIRLWFKINVLWFYDGPI